MAFPWAYALTITFVLLLVAAVASRFTSPVEKILKDFLIWVDRDLGPRGPLALVVAYIPLTILAVPASVLTLGGGYIFGHIVAFVADSIGATIGAGAAFLVGRTIVLLLRLVPLLPFNMLNYLLSVTPVSLGEYLLASWLGMMPITPALVYVGKTLKDISDVTHGWGELSKTHWAFIIISLIISVVLMIWVIKVAKSALDIEGTTPSPELLSTDPSADLNQPLIT